VREVFSAVDLAAALPPEQVEALLAGDLELPVGDLVSEDGLRFMLLPSGFTTEDLQGWLTFAERTPEIRVLTGMPVVWDEIARLVLNAQVVSLAVAFVLVALMLLASYRRLRQTLVSLIPITLTLGTMLGFIAVSGIQLNLLTAVVGGIVIGVGIDYAIHFVAAIDRARRDGPGYVLRAIDRAGRPIVANALGIAVALSALWLSPLAIHPQFSNDHGWRCSPAQRPRWWSCRRCSRPTASRSGRAIPRPDRAHIEASAARGARDSVSRRTRTDEAAVGGTGRRPARRCSDALRRYPGSG
jgi:hypothetical protein